MGRITGPKCRLCRREGAKLFLKGPRCDSPKCALGRRDYPPGVQSSFRRKISDYGLQLREKQKLKRFYGVRERQFRRYFQQAERGKGNTGITLLLLLERRLDNVMCRLGLADSHAQARQLITHGHIQVNGSTVSTPSVLVKPGDVIAPRQRPSSSKLVAKIREGLQSRPVPSWLEVTPEPLQGRVLNLPNREEVPVPVREDLIVEFCSR